jgi:hypothetical protein
MFKLFAIAAIALAAVSSVSGAAIPRATPPQGWEADILEVRFCRRILPLILI